MDPPRQSGSGAPTTFSRNSLRTRSFWKVQEISRNSRKSTAQDQEPAVCRRAVIRRSGTATQYYYFRFIFVFWSSILRNPPLGVWTCTDVSPSKINGSQIRVLQNALFLSNLARDRIAPDLTIRHSVWLIAALQRRTRFSARFAGFCRIRCHQRRAIRAEQASFSVLVSNLDFRVPRLRQIGERAADRAMRAAEKRPPERPRIEAGATVA